MTNPIIHIKCPFCSAVLSIRDNAANANKSVTCPVCKQKSPITKFTMVKLASSASEEKKNSKSEEKASAPSIGGTPTQLDTNGILNPTPTPTPAPSTPGKKSQTSGGTPTQYKNITVDPVPPTPGGNSVKSFGRIKTPTGQSFMLNLGRNVIGRLSSQSQADIKLSTEGNRQMSREHIVIDVKDEPGMGIMQYLSLYKEKVNPTFLGGMQLKYGDIVTLQHGDQIGLPGVTLIFEKN